MKQLTKYLLGISILLWSCNDDSAPQPDDREYFPLRVGYYQLYSVEETEYININQSSFSSYELKTEIVDSLTDLSGNTAYVIHRSKRTNEADSWEFMDTWSARSSAYEAVIVEGTTSFIRIAFPAFENKEWNGNALNTMEEDMYVCDGKGHAFELENHQTFEDCLLINQEEYLDVLSKVDRQEVYARNVGLIYKKNITLNYCDEGVCFGQQVIVDGIEYIQVLKEYGQN